MDAFRNAAHCCGRCPPKINTLTSSRTDALNEVGVCRSIARCWRIAVMRKTVCPIARLTGEAAEKVLSRVEQAKAQQDRMAAENCRVLEAPGAIRLLESKVCCNHLVDMEREAQVWPTV